MIFMSHKQLIGAHDAARLLQVSRATVHRWASNGRLAPAGTVGDKRFLVFEREAVEALAQASLKGSRHG